MYCSSGYDRIIVLSNGTIINCYNKYQKIGDIWSYNFEKDKKIYECKESNCISCDKYNSYFSDNKNEIINLNRAPCIELVITERCYHFCPYCSVSDFSKKSNKPIYPLPINEYLKFLNSIKRKSKIVLAGGEPTLRKDLYELFAPTNHFFMLFSASLYYDNIIKAFDEINKNKVYVEYVPSLHHTSKDFDWKLFWQVIKYAKNIPTINLKRINIVDYKLDKVINKIKYKCKQLDIHLEIKKLILEAASKRINENKKFKSI